MLAFACPLWESSNPVLFQWCGWVGRSLVLSQLFVTTCHNSETNTGTFSQCFKSQFVIPACLIKGRLSDCKTTPSWWPSMQQCPSPLLQNLMQCRWAIYRSSFNKESYLVEQNCHDRRWRSTSSQTMVEMRYLPRGHVSSQSLRKSNNSKLMEQKEKNKNQRNCLMNGRSRNSSATPLTMWVTNLNNWKHAKSFKIPNLTITINKPNPLPNML